MTLLTTALLIAGALSNASPLDIPLDATPAQVQAALGAPDHVREERTFRVWDYNLGPADQNDMGYAWSFFFEAPSGRLLSITHNVAGGVSVKPLFREATFRKAVSPAPAKLPVLYSAGDGERMTIAVGIASPEQPCSQVIIIRRSVLDRFYPWLSENLITEPRP